MEARRSGGMRGWVESWRWLESSECGGGGGVEGAQRGVGRRVTDCE